MARLKTLSPDERRQRSAKYCREYRKKLKKLDKTLPYRLTPQQLQGLYKLFNRD